MAMLWETMIVDGSLRVLEWLWLDKEGAAGWGAAVVLCCKVIHTLVAILIRYIIYLIGLGLICLD